MSETEPDGHLRFFPYEEPYPNQRRAMRSIADALDDRRDVLLEGAPGTGKTLAALAPALQFARERDKTVVITTNVHQQMRQFVEEARAITRNEPIKAVVMHGKESMCHIGVDYQECQSLRDATRSVVEKAEERDELERRQRDLLARSREGDEEAAEARAAVMDELDAVESELAELEEGNVCERYRENLTGDTDEFYAWLFDDVRTPDQIYEYAHERGFCGYELLKDGLEQVELVICNYHHLLDPGIREGFFRWLDRDPEDVIAVFDEAHNVADAARDHATRTLTENTLSEALAELDEADDSRAGAARNVLGAFATALTRTYEAGLSPTDREAVGDDWEELPIANDDRRDDLTLAFLDAYHGQGIDAELDLAIQVGEAFDEAYERAYREGDATTRSESQTLQAAAFVWSWLADGTDVGHHPTCAVRRDATTEEVYGRAELYGCIPRNVTADLFEEVHASVLMSATLRPFDVTEGVLGLDGDGDGDADAGIDTDGDDGPVRLAYGLEYPEENRRTYAVGTPALFANEREEPATQTAVADALADAVRFTPGNALLFFPSYREAERYRDLLAERETGTTLLLDEAGVRTESLRRRFVDRDDAALFTSLWGTLAEGVSFDGDDARTVAVVGVPYPRLTDRLEAVQDAYERVYGDRRSGRGGDGDAGWRYAVEIPTIRKTRQALGRVIRSPEEVGARVLLDERYTDADMGKYGVRDAFPSDERRELVDVAPEKLKFGLLNFYTDHDAYDGAPPRP